MNEVATPSRFDKLEAEIAKLPPVDLALVHHWAPGLYAREMRIPAGTALTGKIHKTEHVNMILAGDITVFDEQNGTKRIKAPYTFVSKPGARRAGYAHEDTVWICVHPTKETDLAKIEEEVIASSQEEVAEYQNSLKITRGRDIAAIYLIRNLVNNKIYVGSSRTVAYRWSNHRYFLKKNGHCNEILQRAWNKYGEDSFEFRVLEKLKDESLLIEQEQYWLDLLTPEYNILKVAGRTTGHKWSSESRAKLSASKTGKAQPKESVDRRAAKLRGRKPSEEVRIKLSVAQKLRRRKDWLKMGLTPELIASIKDRFLSGEKQKALSLETGFNIDYIKHICSGEIAL